MKCQHDKKGKRCRAHALTGSDFCFFHDPTMALKRKESQIKGGINRRIPTKTHNESQDIRKVQDIKRVLVDTLMDVVNMENSVSRARTIGYLCKILLKVLYTVNIEKRSEDPESTFEDLLPVE